LYFVTDEAVTERSSGSAWETFSDTGIAGGSVTNTHLADMAQATIKGRASGAGTGDPTDLTATQATAILNNVVGDSGSGGTKGLVPAPASGDAAAAKFLKADGSWAVPAGAGDVVGPGSATDNAVARFDGTTGKLIQNTSVVTLSDAGAFTFPDDVRQTFNPGSNNAGVNVGALAGDPSSPSNGDLWYDSSANELTARINGANVALGAGSSASDSFKTIAVSGQSDVVADSSTDTLTLAAGTNVTITTNAGTDTITIAASSAGGLVLLEQHTASGSATLDFTTRNAAGQSGDTFQSDYDEYLIELVNVVPASDTDLKMLVSSNNGSSWDGTAGIYVYGYQYVNQLGSTGVVNSGGTTTIHIFSAESSSSAGIVASLRLFSPLNSSVGKPMTVTGQSQNSDGNWYSWHGGAFYNSANVINAVQFKMASGNIASGVIRIYGYAK
jgi:hypothetical protein